MPEVQFLVVLLLATISITSGVIDYEEDFAFDSYNEPLVDIYQNEEYDNYCLVQRLWGIPDMPAYIGHVFYLRIPTDAFSGKVVDYKISGADGALPSWLSVGNRGVIRGIPGPEDQGEHRVRVAAMAENHKSQHCSPAIEVFTIDVRDKKESPIMPRGENQCHFGEDETRLILIIGKPFQQITPKHRLNSIIKIAHFMDLDYNAFSIQTREVFMDNNVDHVDVLMSSVSGARKEHHKETSEIVLTVGCSGILWTKYSHLVHKIKQLVIDGTISEVVHLPIKECKIVRYKQPPFSRTRRMMRFEGSTDDDNDESNKYNIVVDKMYKHLAEQEKKYKPVVRNKDDKSKVVVEGPIESHPAEIAKNPAINNFTMGIMVQKKDDKSKEVVEGPIKSHPAEVAKNPAIDNFTIGIMTTDTVTVELNTNEPTHDMTTEILVVNSSTHEVLDITTEILVVNSSTTPGKQRRMTAISGKYFSYTIPVIEFENEMDASNLQLAVYNITHVPLQPSSWLQFNPKTKEIYGLPLDDHITEWEYIIEATDSQGVSVKKTLNITVQEYKEKSDVNHEFSMRLHVEKKYPAPVDWQIRTLKGLVNLFRGTDMNNITVRGVNVESDPVEFLWTNDSLPKYRCARSEILQLMGVILEPNTDGQPSLALITAMSPELRVNSTSWRAMDSCNFFITVIIISIFCIAGLLMGACAAYFHKRGRMANVRIAGQKHFHSKDIPALFDNKIKEKSEQSEKFSVIMKDEKPPSIPTRDYENIDSNPSTYSATRCHSTFRPSNKKPHRNFIKTPPPPPPYAL